MYYSTVMLFNKVYITSIYSSKLLAGICKYETFNEGL